MRNKRLSFLIFVLFLGMLLLICSAFSAQDITLSQVTFLDAQHGISLTPWYDEASGEYYLFLPSFVSRENLALSCPWYMGVHILLNGEIPDVLPVAQKLDVTLRYIWGEKQTCRLQLLQCSAKETIYIEAQDGMLDYLHEDQTREREIFITFLNDAGEAEYQGFSTISGRGNATWAWEKKPYDLKFSDPITVGPFHQIDKLCLLAEYTDYSKLRNALGYFAGQALNFPYASPYIFADVYLNGAYQGLFGIATKQEYTKHIEEDGIQTVFELSASGKDVAYYSEKMTKEIRIHYGDLWLAYDKIAAMETALLNRDWDTLYQIIDLNSWARKYAMEELFYNFDMSLTSQYFYLDESGKIFCMLPWDYECILYSRFYPYNGTAEYAMSSYWNRPNWLELLLESGQFREALASALENTFTDELLSNFDQYLADCEAETAASWHCDILRWKDAYSRSNTALPGHTSQEEYRAQFHDYLLSRRDYLKNLLNNWDSFYRISLYSQLDNVREPIKLHLILPAGADLHPYHSRIQQTIDTPEGYTILGWYTEDGIPMEEITTVTGNLSFVVHYRSTGNGGTP